jgi:hypothetical protein
MTSMPTSPMTSQTASYDQRSSKEGQMFDRDRFLAADHESRLLAEARARRLASLATHQGFAGRTGRSRDGRTGRSLVGRARLALGQRLVGAGRRLDTASEPCGPEARAV